MPNPKIEGVWELYPQSHLHCDVKVAGQNSYEIVVSLIDKDGESVAQINHYGNGNLDTLRQIAFERLADKLHEIANPQKSN